MVRVCSLPAAASHMVFPMSVVDVTSLLGRKPADEKRSPAIMTRPSKADHRPGTPSVDRLPRRTPSWTPVAVDVITLILPPRPRPPYMAENGRVWLPTRH